MNIGRNNVSKMITRQVLQVYITTSKHLQAYRLEFILNRIVFLHTISVHHPFAIYVYRQIVQISRYKQPICKNITAFLYFILIKSKKKLGSHHCPSIKKKGKERAWKNLIGSGSEKNNTSGRKDERGL